MSATELEQALQVFLAAMLAKFHKRAEKQGARSVTLVGSKHLNEPAVHSRTWEHLMEEIDELGQAVGPDENKDEAIDVANCAFLLWWGQVESKETNHG